MINLHAWWFITSTHRELIEAVVFDIAEQYDLTTHGVNFSGQGGFTIVYRNNETRDVYKIGVERPSLIDIVSGDTYEFIDRSIQEALGLCRDEDGEPC